VKKISDLYAKAHEAIRKSPASAKKENKHYKPKVIQKAPTLIMQSKDNKKWLRQRKIGIVLRKQRIQTRMAVLLAAE
jgi:hypothetical protein